MPKRRVSCKHRRQACITSPFGVPAFNFISHILINLLQHYPPQHDQEPSTKQRTSITIKQNDVASRIRGIASIYSVRHPRIHQSCLRSATTHLRPTALHIWTVFCLLAVACTTKSSSAPTSTYTFCITLPCHRASLMLRWRLVGAAPHSKQAHPRAIPADPSYSRKCFSPEERDLITQQSRVSSRASSHTSTLTSTQTSSSHKRRRKQPAEPSHISTLPNNWKPNSDRKQKSSMTSSFLRSRRRHSRPTIEQQASVSEDQAAWFLSLPDKVKRQHFSKEEQTLLTDRCQSALDKAAPCTEEESAQDWCRRQLNQQPNATVNIKTRRRSSAPATRCFDEQAIADFVKEVPQKSIEDDDEDAGEGDVDKMSILNMYSRRHSIATTRNSVPAPPVIPPAQIRSFRRSFALRPLPLAAPVLAPFPSPGFFSESQKPAKLRRRQTALSITAPEPSPEASPEAKHYQDPDVRLALRAMTSQELFDDTLEHGFPAPPQGPPRTAESRPVTSDGNAVANDRSSSLTSSSTANTLPGRGPSTPVESQPFPEPAVAGKDANTTTAFHSSPDSLPSQHVNRQDAIADHSRTPSMQNREMTLRMTLTRPILRAPEDEIKPAPKSPLETPFIDQYDPLALESITICDDPTGAQGAFAIPENSQSMKGIRKVLKSLVGK